MSDEQLLSIALTAARSVLAVVAGVVLVVAGHDMRGQGSGIPWPYGLVAYGLALLSFAYAVPVRLPFRRSDHARWVPF